MGPTEMTYQFDVLVTLLKRNGDRYASQFLRSQTDMQPVRDWFAEWHLAIQRALAVAINERDSIIGKQWLYDDLTRRHRLSELPPR